MTKKKITKYFASNKDFDREQNLIKKGKNDNFTTNKDSQDNSGKTEVKGKDVRREWGEGGISGSHSSLTESGPISNGSSSNKQQQQN